jgi:hypothetical protein
MNEQKAVEALQKLGVKIQQAREIDDIDKYIKVYVPEGFSMFHGYIHDGDAIEITAILDAQKGGFIMTSFTITRS